MSCLWHFLQTFLFLHNKLSSFSPFVHPASLSIQHMVLWLVSVCAREVGAVFCLSAWTSQPKAWPAHEWVNICQRADFWQVGEICLACPQKPRVFPALVILCEAPGVLPSVQRPPAGPVQGGEVESRHRQMEFHVTTKLAFKVYLMPIKMLRCYEKGRLQTSTYAIWANLFLFSYKHRRKYANMLTIVRWGFL